LTLTLAETPVPFTVRLAGVNVIAPANGLAPRNSMLTVVPSSVFSRSFPSGPPAIRNAVLVGAPFKVMMTAAVDAPVEWLKATKLRDGRFCFLCPRCNEMLAYVNFRNNLAHCFHCGTNLNNIDLLRTMGFDFPSAVEILERWLNEYERRRTKPPSADRK